MLNTSRKLYAAIAGAILLVAMILSWASTHSSSYEVCRDERYSSSSEKAPDLSKKIAYFFICEGVAIDANGDLITAVATFFMAIFTATLWFVTDKALNLSREEFHATFRPQLEIKFIRRIPESMSVEFSVINTGFGEARFIKGMALYDRMTRDDVTSPFDLQGEKFSLR